MAHFQDLAPYNYDHSNGAGGVVHIGWLGRGHEFTKGPVHPSLISKMTELAKAPVELYRGYHVCDLCEEPEEVKRDRIQKWEEQKAAIENKDNRPMRDFMSQLWASWTEKRQSNGEIRVSRNGVTYAAPLLITHYIEEHGYQPPQEFLDALTEAEPARPANASHR